MHRTRLFRYVWIGVSIGSVTAAAAAEPEPLWRIGQTDRNYVDLAFTGLDPSFLERFPGDVRFVIGRSDGQKDFSAIHPGPADRWAKSREHPFRVEFSLADPPTGNCELRIDLVDTEARKPPALRVSVNGKAAQTTLHGGMGEFSLVRPEAGRARELRFVLGPTVLRQGVNEIELRIVGGSWLLYDSLSLWRLKDGEQPPVRLSARPTVFFVERDGHVQQEIAVTADGLLTDEPVRVDIRSGGATSTTTLGRSSLGFVSGAAYVDASDVSRELSVTLSAGAQSGTASITQTPQKRWRLYCAPSTHTDIGYTDLQERVIELHNRNTDVALGLIDRFPLYHFNLESSWAAQNWLRDRPPERHEALYEAARRGRLGIEAAYINLLTGLCSDEELIRVMYYSARLHRTHDVPFVSYTLTDAPSHVWSLPSILAGAGIRYLSVGVNQSRAPLFKKDIHRKSPFWWEGPDGGRVLTWFAVGYKQASDLALTTRADTRRLKPDSDEKNAWVGLERMRDAIEGQVAWWNLRTDYPYDAVLYHGAYDDNVYIFPDLAEAVTAYNSVYAYPKVILCSNAEFFKYIEERFAGKIPTVRGDGGSWWEDGAASSAFETAANRQAHQTIVAAETAWAVAAAAQPALKVPQADLDGVWQDILLFDEHTWGSQNSISDPSTDKVHRQWAYKARFANDAAGRSRRLLRDGLHAMAPRLGAGDDAVLVFNPTGRPQTGAVYADIPRGTEVSDGGNRLPQQDAERDPAGDRTVAFFASDVPAAGYRIYPLRPSKDSEPPPSGRADNRVLENAFYRVTLDAVTGGVASLVDKELGKELVDPKSAYKLGQLIYAAGGEARGRSPEPAAVKLTSPASCVVKPGEAGSVFRSVRTVSKMTRFPQIEMEVVLYERMRRVDFVFRVRKELTYDKEALYIAFPIAGTNPRFRYEIGGASVRPNDDQFPGACRDWFAVQRWVTVNTDDAGVAWSAIDTPLITLCDLTPGKWLDELPITNGTIFAYVMNNYWYTNYKAGQDGEFTFRYSLTSDKSMDPATAARFGESVHMPLPAMRLTSGGNEASPAPPTKSFCRIEPGNVTLTTLKPADDGNGLILRLRETAGRATDARITISFPGIANVWRCDLVERTQDEVPADHGQVTIPVGANAMATLRLGFTSSRGDRPGPK